MAHYFGQQQNVEQFWLLCFRHNLLQVENNPHGYGGYLAGKPLGVHALIESSIILPNELIYVNRHLMFVVNAHLRIYQARTEKS